MIDFHTHILPGIDDGSKNIEMTEAMLDEELSQGVSHIYATPHFYASRRSVQSFLERREGALDTVRELQKRRPELPVITAGAEVYYFHGMGRAEQLPDLCIEGTNILLLEMPFEQWHSEQYRDVTDIIKKRGLRVVLAHIERYEGFQKRTDVFEEVLGLPLTIQMNAGSFISGIGMGMRARHTAKFCFGMLGEFSNCIIGTDCHNMTSRKPNLKDARAMIEKKAGRERLLQIDRYTEELLGRI